ncbi:hypothetical protein JXB01_04250 [Candidatus Micrarchaeota archaeon]|nr:hypothetical protein [Candidatus Micrarchaeota archaeon]
MSEQVQKEKSESIFSKLLDWKTFAVGGAAALYAKSKYQEIPVKSFKYENWKFMAYLEKQKPELYKSLFGEKKPGKVKVSKWNINKMFNNPEVLEVLGDYPKKEALTVELFKYQSYVWSLKFQWASRSSMKNLNKIIWDSVALTDSEKKNLIEIIRSKSYKHSSLESFFESLESSKQFTKEQTKSILEGLKKEPKLIIDHLFALQNSMGKSIFRTTYLKKGAIGLKGLKPSLVVSQSFFLNWFDKNIAKVPTKKIKDFLKNLPKTAWSKKGDLWKFLKESKKEKKVLFWGAVGAAATVFLLWGADWAMDIYNKASINEEKNLADAVNNESKKETKLESTPVKKDKKVSKVTEEKWITKAKKLAEIYDINYQKLENQLGKDFVKAAYEMNVLKEMLEFITAKKLPGNAYSTKKCQEIDAKRTLNKTVGDDEINAAIKDEDLLKIAKTKLNGDYLPITKILEARKKRKYLKK